MMGQRKSDPQLFITGSGIGVSQQILTDPYRLLFLSSSDTK